MNRRKCGQVSLRRGMTRVEVLAVIGACLLVAMIVVPGVAQSRQAARKLQCLNNVRTVALGFMNCASQKQGKLPPFSTSNAVKNAAGQEGELPTGWPMILLPFLDQAALMKKIESNAVIEEGKARIGEQEQVSIGIFACPDDEDSFKKPGGLSYVVNAGFISAPLFQGDPDEKHIVGSLAWKGEPGDADAVAIHAATGAFWRSSASFQSSLDTISQGDGCSSTIMITENLQAGNWDDTDTAKIGFGYPTTNTKGKVSMGEGETFESAIKPLNTEFRGGTLVTVEFQDWQLNKNREAKVGTLARPSSNHGDRVNAIFCDGAGKELSQKIDPHVYLKLITSDGVSYGEGLLVPPK